MKAFFLLALFLLFPCAAQAATGCNLILSYPDGKVLHHDGDCETRRSPVSTFKIPLALMGFDSGILTDEHTPSLPYRAEYNGLDFQQITTDPIIWERESIVWYSQQLTKKLGPEKFQRYVNRFDYGNKDLSGHPDRNDGLTNAWLFTSLAISPKEQVNFLSRLLNRDLGVSTHAYNMTMAIIPTFKTGNWTVHGKTGSGQINDDVNNPQGWFVGWADNGRQKIVFAKLILPGRPLEKAGLKARAQFLAEMPALLKRH
ncbi:MAG: beta-lactamase [Micavibrio sp.]|nr:beta-lactamase [Micavibrio sp.]